MNALPWKFAVRPEDAVQTDPSEEEFFIGPSDGELDGGHVDALVRESIQNAIDAKVGDEPVRVKYAIHDEPHLSLGRYLDGLRPHLESLNVEWPAGARTRWLVYEDFATSGLCGDPSIIDDPVIEAGRREDFYWFWRNVGRSAKTGEKLGRWGLGKTVFPSSSQINTVIGLTKRFDDGRSLIMGQAVLRNHALDGTRYLPYGTLHDPHQVTRAAMPIESEDEVLQLRQLFQIERRDETGLSLIVPFLRPGITAELIARSACVHFFIRILRGHLVVETVNEDGQRRRIDKTNIQDVVKRLTWNGPASAKLAAPPPLDLAEWALTAEIDEVLPAAGTNGNANWNSAVLPRPVATSLAGKLNAGEQRVAVRVPLFLEAKSGDQVETYFDVFFGRHAHGKGDSWHVRDGMTITAVGTGRPAGGDLEGLMLVTDKTLSGFLGDAEGPAHVDWSTTEKRLTKNWQTFTRRLQFIRGAISKMADLLRQSEPKPAPVALKNVFSVSMPRGDSPANPPKPSPVVTSRAKWFTVDRISEGFCVRSDPRGTRPDGMNLRVKFAYDVPSGDPFRRWSSFDFEMHRDFSGSLNLSGRAVKGIRRAGNELTLVIEQTPFALRVCGFDKFRDVVVRVEPELPLTADADEYVDI